VIDPSGVKSKFCETIPDKFPELGITGAASVILNGNTRPPKVACNLLLREKNFGHLIFQLKLSPACTKQKGYHENSFPNAADAQLDPLGE
jgi:hypothetical protein